MYHYVAFLLATQLFVVPCIQALGILLPLNIYPNSNCTSWAPVSAAISTQPRAKWYIIVNPDNGPGPTDATYQSCVSKIPASDGQIIMGLVDTLGGNVDGDIDTYAGWDSAARPVGIFFDNVSPTADHLSTYQAYASHARSKGFTFIGLDPGETTDASFFSMADLVNTYEDSYSAFNANSLSGNVSKQSVILVDAPASGSYSTVINQLEAVGAAAVYISNVADNQQDLPVQLSEFAKEVASAGRSGTSSSPSSTASATTTTVAEGLPQSSSTGGGSTQTSAPSKKSPPIGAIVGGVLGALIIIIILVLVALFLRLRRRRRRRASVVVPFPSESPILIPVSNNWHVKASAAPTYSSTSDPDPRQPASPTPYGSARDSLVVGSETGPPPSYHN
ncbi:Spherulation-specific family 4-domain-containing protein [Mycena filopes]|nr:Spherulation-specific family 4-domain-containing protein [Mycena filopes]